MLHPGQVRYSIDIKKIWISPGHDFKGRYGKDRLENGILSVPEVECHAGRGLVGDRYYDHQPDFKGQITFIDEAVLHDLSNYLKKESIQGSLLRRNVLIAGIDLNEFIGKTFSIGRVTFSGSEECSPCFWMDEAVGEGAFEWLKGRGGLRCRILEDGKLHCGQQFLETLA